MTVKRAVTAAIEREVERLGLAAVHALDHDVVGQFHQPPGRGRQGCRLGDGASPVQPPAQPLGGVVAQHGEWAR
jgi:hypothetical protein